jgi:hypothetical protein
MEHRNLNVGGANIQKESVRVLMGMHQIDYKYKDEDHSIFIAADGQGVFYESIPQDMERPAQLDSMKLEHEAMCKRFGMMTFLAIITLSIYTFVSKKYITFKERAAQKAASLQSIADFESVLPNIKNQFVNSGGMLKGIYEDAKNQ